MNTPFPVVFNCPLCGQGGLKTVWMSANPGVELTVCYECERLWQVPNKVGWDRYEEVETVLVNLGMEPIFMNLIVVADGVAWDRLDPGYQSFILYGSQS